MALSFDFPDNPSFLGDDVIEGVWDGRRAGTMTA